MIAGQAKLTGPSLKGISTELREEGKSVSGTEPVSSSSQEKDSLKPVLDTLQLSLRNSIDMDWGPREILEDKHHIKVL